MSEPSTGTHAFARLDDLKRLLAPYPAVEFVSEIWGRTFLHVRGDASKFRHWCGWPDLNTVLEHHRLDAPRLRFVREGMARDELAAIKYSPSPAGGQVPRLDVRKAMDLLRDGATLILDGAEEAMPPLRALAMNFEAALGHKICINLYAAWGDAAGFGLHWDNHDVFVLQLEGRKRWRIWEPSLRYPLRGVDEARPEGAPAWQGVLETGDMLYVPRGFWHDVVGMEVPTLHATMGSANPTGLELLKWLVDACSRIEDFRADVPLFDEAARKDYVERLKAHLLERWDDGAVDRMLAQRRSQLQHRPAFSLPWGVLLDTPLPEGNFSVRYEGAACDLSTFIGDERVVRILSSRSDGPFSTQSKPIVERIFKRGRMKFSDLAALGPGKRGEAVARQVVSELLAMGIVKVD